MYAVLLLMPDHHLIGAICVSSDGAVDCFVSDGGMSCQHVAMATAASVNQCKQAINM
jgi:hypothetical protein